jgi:hypothetical protein
MEPISTADIPMLREFGEWSELDERDSSDSLRLSPWVQSRIRELRIHELREKGPPQGVEVMETRVVAQRKWVR